MAIDTVKRLAGDVKGLNAATAAQHKAEHAFNVDTSKEKAALANIDRQRKAITDAFVSATPPTGAKQKQLLDQLFALGEGAVHTRDTFSARLAADRRLISKDAATARSFKMKGLKDLPSAEYRMSLGQTNAYRKALGLKPVSKPIRPPAPKTQTYVVRSGDTLGAIASRFHTTVAAIAARNHISNPNLISVGERLVISGPPPKSAPAPNGSHASIDRGSIYLSQPNGFTCGPTSLAMAEAAWGIHAANNGSINRLSSAMHVTTNGLPGSAALIASQARNDGLKATFSSSDQSSAVRQALKEGKTCVVNGSLSSGGHFIYVGGLDSAGRFIIFDPARSGIRTMTGGQLDAFMQANRGQHPTGFAAIWR